MTTKVKSNMRNYFSNVNSMSQDSKLTLGDIAHTRGFYQEDDNGAGKYIITNDTPNGFDTIALANGLSAKLLVEDTVDIQQVGAIPQNDKRWFEVEDQYDAHDAIQFAFDNYKSVKGSGRYLSLGVLRTPQRYNGNLVFGDDYRWQLQGYNQFEIVFDLTVVPQSERSNANTTLTDGYAVGFGLSHKDYTKPNEWENGSSIYNGLQRNISIRDISFWNRNWTEEDQNNEALENEVGFSLFAGADITVDNVVVWGFKVNFMTSCWASTFTNIRPRNGEYGFVPYAGTTITANGVFAGSNKHAITTAGVSDLHSTSPITYGLTLNCPATDASREIAYRLSNVDGCIINIPSMEGFEERGIVLDNLCRDISINGNVLTPYTATQEDVIRVETLSADSGNISIKNFHAEAEEVRLVMAFFVTKADISKVTFENVTCGDTALLTNLTEDAETFLDIKKKPYLSRNNILPANNQFTIQTSDLNGFANDYGAIPDTAYDYYTYDITLKVNDGTNFFIYDYTLLSTRGSAATRSYAIRLRDSYAVVSGTPPTLAPTVTVTSPGGIETLVLTFNESGNTDPWNILGLYLEFNGRM